MAQDPEDRRSFLRKAGTVAWATPFVLTLSASRAGALAFSCLPNGSACGFYSPNAGICVFGPSLTCCNTCVPAELTDGSPCTCG